MGDMPRPAQHVFVRRAQRRGPWCTRTHRHTHRVLAAHALRIPAVNEADPFPRPRVPRPRPLHNKSSPRKNTVGSRAPPGALPRRALLLSFRGVSTWFDKTRADGAETCMDRGGVSFFPCAFFLGRRFVGDVDKKNFKKISKNFNTCRFTLVYSGRPGGGGGGATRWQGAWSRGGQKNMHRSPWLVVYRV